MLDITTDVPVVVVTADRCPLAIDERALVRTL